jgi:hypothetical protein
MRLTGHRLQAVRLWARVSQRGLRTGTAAGLNLPVLIRQVGGPVIFRVLLSSGLAICYRMIGQVRNAPTTACEKSVSAVQVSLAVGLASHFSIGLLRSCRMVISSSRVV